MRFPDPKKVKSILYIAPGGIGNVLLLTPSIQILETAYPDASFNFLLDKNGSKTIVQNHPKANRIIELDANKKLFDYIKIIRNIRADMLIAQAGINPLKAGLLGILSGIPYRVGESFGLGAFFYNYKCKRNFLEHEVISNLKIIFSLGIPQSQPTLKVWETQADHIWAKEFIHLQKLENKKIVGVHPGSGGLMAFKRWPIDRFAVVCNWLQVNYKVKIIVFGGKDETPLAEEIKHTCLDEVIDLTGKTSILQSYALMKYCSLFVANDTSPMHLATAAKVPVVAIYGPTSEKQIGPWGVQNQVLTYDCACRPCYGTRKKKTNSFSCNNKVQYQCLQNISSEKVLNALEQFISNSQFF